ncbi:MAG: DUF1080 domain-containing protein [Chthoniobacter sp.]|uniref:3-keto-disaccharide hydrolase n=1 Tax=Chthoniobacter sp. TaxID=2510640 RepID=UPI0032AB2640
MRYSRPSFPSPIFALLVLMASLVAPGLAAPPELVLFNGKNTDGWRPPLGTWSAVASVSLNAGAPRDFTAAPGEGILLNSATGRTSNLLSVPEFADVEAHIEFCLPRGSNSGIYFMGRYEVQIFESWGVQDLQYTDCGGIYARWNKEEKRKFEGHAPRVNASKPAGEWQTFDIVFRAPRFDAAGHKTENARFLKVVHNGVTIHENVEVTGPTNAAAFADEKPLGPLMLQGDHGPVAFRNLRITPSDSQTP